MGSQGKSGKGGQQVLPNSAAVTVRTNAGMVRALLAALRGGHPVTAPVSEVNTLITELLSVLIFVPPAPAPPAAGTPPRP
jgi:hypothetical protein